MNIEKIKKCVEYGFMGLGLIMMIAQIVEVGIYVLGDDATLFIIGLLFFNLGYK